MPPTITDLQRQISDLQSQINAMQTSNGLPRDLETALNERLNFLLSTGTGATGGTSSFNAFPVVVPATPSGTLSVSVNGVTYNLLYR